MKYNSDNGDELAKIRVIYDYFHISIILSHIVHFKIGTVVLKLGYFSNVADIANPKSSIMKKAFSCIYSFSILVYSDYNGISISFINI